MLRLFLEAGDLIRKQRTTVSSGDDPNGENGVFVFPDNPPPPKKEEKKIIMITITIIIIIFNLKKR